MQRDEGRDRHGSGTLIDCRKWSSVLPFCIRIIAAAPKMPSPAGNFSGGGWSYQKEEKKDGGLRLTLNEVWRSKSTPRCLYHIAKNGENQFSFFGRNAQEFCGQHLNLILYILILRRKINIEEDFRFHLKHLQNLYRKCGVSSRWDLLKLRSE